MTKRSDGWEARLFAYLEETRSAPFIRGQNCCALWVLGAVDAVCGTAFAEQHAGHFDSLEGGAQYLSGRGWSDLGEAFAAITGAQPARLATFARVGDVVHVPYREGATFPGGTLFVVLGRDVIGREDGALGLVRIPLRTLLPLGVRAFHV